jgi:hypothetical protein
MTTVSAGSVLPAETSESEPLAEADAAGAAFLLAGALLSLLFFGAGGPCTLAWKGLIWLSTPRAGALRFSG